ncbi:sugar-binding domain-containing protein [Puia dinghuensis]|uniref:beta-galactosidase n=1 Tax=Puia dinghuensis TaxID=1792502 RepID=A0A8J2XW45_9BACT|nr:sugar-binding domain-containing protein [Puia dinghuensis]GGB21408.1 hypothetical protein GCM10011511_51510 [Puia dinghuensis]
MRAFPTILLLVGFLSTHAADTLSLAGVWRFRMDPHDEGEAQHWFAKKLPDSIYLPGSMMQNGKGDPVTIDTKWTASIYDSSWFFDPRMAKYRQPGNLKFPFWLTPPKHYLGAAWYQRTIDIPAGWQGRHIVLYLERPHSETTVWLDDKPMGHYYGFCTAQEFDLTGLAPGRHLLTLRIDNRIKDINVGPDSHSLTDQTQGNWNGVAGRLLLTARPATYIDDVQVYPDISRKIARVHITVHGGHGSITLSAASFNTSEHQHIPPHTYPITGDSLDIDLPMGDHPLLWDEFDPALYRLRVKLDNGDIRNIEFGMREFKVEGTHFTVNGRTVHLRGMVENCEFPLTGYAPMDERSWERVFRIARSYGLNHMRFHSYCPPEAAFQAADRVGFYLQPEGPSWANHGSSLGDDKPIDQFIFDETNRMATAYGNYASFCMLAYGNEPRGGHQADYLTKFVRYWQNKDRRRVYTGADVGSNWPLIPANDYMVKSGPRGLNWNSLPESMTDYHAVVEKFAVPYVTHEMGQWCAYPDFSEIPRYTGVYKAKNFEIFRDDLGQQGMGDEARRFLMASGKLQALCYKAEIERSLRTKGSAGFQLLCLTDYSGQGTALVGVLDALWQEKGYINAKAWSRFCNSTVPLARLPKFVWYNTDTLTAAIELYHYGKAPLHDAVIDWDLRDDSNAILARGAFTGRDIPTGDVTTIGGITIPLNAISRATHLHLEVAVRNTPYANEWDCWVYPAKLPALSSDHVYYCTELNEKAHMLLDFGGTVFFNAAGKIRKGKEIVMNFTPVFWNTSWFKMRPPHTLGILLDAANPAFQHFPTSYHSDYQWWDILYKAQVMHLEDFPKSFRPLVQPIDTWFLNRRLGLIFEARVGKGRLIVSSADLGPNISADRPASRQLYYSLIKYMESPRFHPAAEIDYVTIKSLINDSSRFVWSAHSRANPDELKPKPDSPIDRHALIDRHNPVNTNADPLSALSVGNGRFAFTVDVTGLQSFPEAYDKGISLGTESEWGWHSFPDTAGYRFAETLKPYHIHGRDITYSVQLKNKAVDYFRENPHRLQLGNIGFELKKQDGSPATLEDIKDIHQELILWSGEIRSHFTLEGTPVDVSTIADPDNDAIAINIHSGLIHQNRLRIRLRLPYPTNAFTDYGDNWTHPEAHKTTIENLTPTGARIRHDLDTTTYYIQATYTNATLTKHQPHYYLITPMAAVDTFCITALFISALPSPSNGETYARIRAAAAEAWRVYWQTGAAVDCSGSIDPRAAELERRIVLSQYLTRIQDAGDYPPQETGLTYNSWYGKPHLEMHWWHDAHFALWNHPELLQRSLDWYATAAAGARAIARRQGYAGLRWQKMTDPRGGESPSSVGAFLIWQQPHFIYLAELTYRAATDKASILKKYGALIDSTADFMASYAAYDSIIQRYVLGPALIPAQERFKADSTVNPCFELAYWRWALAVAQQWRARLGQPANSDWQRVEDQLAPLPQHDGLYYPTEGATDAYTNPRYRGDHPVVLATYGFLPKTTGLDTSTMHATFDWVMTNWDWESTWGWDYPLIAMTATRLGLPEKAIDALLMPVKKNTYLPDGHNYQDERLRLYLPGNGGLLAAVALMCAGFDGCTIGNPGIPKDGKWKVKWEGLQPLP